MGRLIFRRLVFCLFVLWGVTLITFLLSRVVPGDPARLIAGPRANAAAIAHVRSLYGLDQSLLQQYIHYMGDLLHGNLGTSFMTRRPVVQDLRRYFPATIELTLYALLIGVGFALIAALVAARRRGSAVDQSVELTAVFGVSLPAFWVALLLQLVVGVKLQWLPVSGRLDAGQAPPPHITGLYTVDGLLTGHVPVAVSAFQHLLLPALALAVGVYGLMARIVRASLLEVAGEDYVRTAEAKGLTRRRVLGRHVLRNALLPAVTVLGLEFAVLAGGVFVVEYLFAFPGIGQYAFNAFSASDYNAIMGATLLVAVTYVLTNLAVDIAYLYLDPRIRYA
jgi:peptide/nickel transport system permease protein